jgi:hypothetical protein
MESYYTLKAPIRYYGQLPKTLEKLCESAYDAAGTKVRREIVVGEMDFTSDEVGSVVEIDGEPRGFSFAATATPSDEPLDLSHRKEPAHEALANLVLDSGSLYTFTKRWGFLAGKVDQASGRFRTQPEDISAYQELLRKAWSGESAAIKTLAKDIEARLDVGPTGVDVAVLELWNLTRLLFLRDHAARKTKVCQNPDCLSPYFLQRRKGQKFCSHKCAVLMNVRRFRRRRGKL